MEDHPDVLLLKLISRKVTYVHRPLWPQIVAIGRARELWQTKDLSTAARKLLAEVDKVPVGPGREKAAAAKELDDRMLVFIAQCHRESGAHVLQLESWDHSNRTHFCSHSTTPASARKALEDASTEVVSHRRVAFTWGWESEEAALAALKPGASHVTINLRPQDGGTFLRLIHTGLQRAWTTFTQNAGRFTWIGWLPGL